MMHTLWKYCKLTIFVQKKPFLTCNDLVYMTTYTEVAESLIFQCR